MVVIQRLPMVELEAEGHVEAKEQRVEVMQAAKEAKEELIQAALPTSRRQMAPALREVAEGEEKKAKVAEVKVTGAARTRNWRPVAAVAAGSAGVTYGAALMRQCE